MSVVILLLFAAHARAVVDPLCESRLVLEMHQSPAETLRLRVTRSGNVLSIRHASGQTEELTLDDEARARLVQSGRTRINAFLSLAGPGDELVWRGALAPAEVRVRIVKSGYALQMPKTEVTTTAISITRNFDHSLDVAESADGDRVHVRTSDSFAALALLVTYLEALVNGLRAGAPPPANAPGASHGSLDQPWYLTGAVPTKANSIAVPSSARSVAPAPAPTPREDWPRAESPSAKRRRQVRERRRRVD